MLTNTQNQYGCIGKILHWLLALLTLGMLTVGLFHHPLRALMPLHKVFGLVILPLSLMTFIWTIINPHPNHLNPTPCWQKALIRTLQYSMLIILIIMALSGWLFATLAGKAPHIANLILAMPNAEKFAFLGHFSKNLHQYLGYTLLALVCIHSFAAFYHHFYLKDDVLKRMLLKH